MVSDSQLEGIANALIEELGFRKIMDVDLPVLPEYDPEGNIYSGSVRALYLTHPEGVIVGLWTIKLSVGLHYVNCEILVSKGAYEPDPEDLQGIGFPDLARA